MPADLSGKSKCLKKHRRAQVFKTTLVKLKYTMAVTTKLLEPIHPGEILLKDFMTPMGISIKRLAHDLAVPPGRVTAIVNGKRAITMETALRLGKFFGVSPQTWIGLQTEYDLRVAQRTIDIATATPPDLPHL